MSEYEFVAKGPLKLKGVTGNNRIKKKPSKNKKRYLGEGPLKLKDVTKDSEMKKKRNLDEAMKGI